MFNEKVMERLRSAKSVRSASVEKDQRVEALRQEGYLAKQIASILGMELSEVKIKLGEFVLCEKP